MAENIEKQKAELEKLEKLVDSYAQSRSLGLLLFAMMTTIATVLVVVLMEFAFRKPVWWFVSMVILLMAGIGAGGFWLTVKLLPRYEKCFYKKEGQIELEQKKIPIWTIVFYVAAFLVSAALNMRGIIPIRWALPLALVSLGVFIFYASGKEKNKPLGRVFCGLLLLEATATAAGMLTPFSSKNWVYSYYAALMIFIAGAGFITAIVVHLYNRRILKKIKQTRPFDEEQSNTANP